MSALHSRLDRLLAEGHARDVELLNDANFARAERKAEAAVLIAVTERAEPGVILTQRPNTMRDHPGQVAFPGGKLDAGEDAIEAALREAEEELAMPRDAVRIVAPTDRFQTGTGFDITPVVGVIPPDLPLVPHPREVESWFEVPLRTLLHPESFEEKEAFWRGADRRYHQLDWDGYRIWGVTAAIILNLGKRIAWEEFADG